MFSIRLSSRSRYGIARGCGAAALISALTATVPATAEPLPDPTPRVTATVPPVSQYRVNPGDDLDVFVWGEERMQRLVRVQPDGTFSFPLAGTIRAVGRNVTDIAADIRERIAVNYRSTAPDVTVSVRDATGLRFFVVGKVRTPGSFTSGGAVNILQALSMAGGAAEFADISNAVILRQTPSGQIVEPVQLNTVLKGKRALKAGTLSKPLPMLMSGDVLVIP